MDQDPYNFIDVNGTLFFAANDGVNGIELWKSDGTDAGTMLVKNIASSNASCFINYYFEKLDVNGTLFFEASATQENNELWKSDGTAAGTQMVKDLNPGSNGSNPQNFTSLNGELFFTHAYNGLNQELWKSDGTEAGTVIVKSFGSGYDDDLITQITAVGDRVFLTVDDGIHGFEAWMSDGTECNTVLVADINPGSGFSIPTGFLNTPDGVYFSAFTPEYGWEWWKYTVGNFPDPLTSSLPSALLCPGDIVDITYHFTCTVLAGNVYTAELSDGLGRFFIAHPYRHFSKHRWVRNNSICYSKPYPSRISLSYPGSSIFACIYWY
jgi:ELWxxDGT repeat protein